jgi:hypothetical protein
MVRLAVDITLSRIRRKRKPISVPVTVWMGGPAPDWRGFMTRLMARLHEAVMARQIATFGLIPVR